MSKTFGGFFGNVPEPDPNDMPKQPTPELEASLGAQIDQARMEFIQMLDALVATAREKPTPGSPLALPACVVSISRGLQKIFPDQPETHLWYVTNMLAEATLRLAHPDPTRDIPLPKETP